MPDGSVPITPGTGANVDVSQLTRHDSAGTLVDRQRVVLAGNSDVDSIASVADGELETRDTDMRVLMGVLIREVCLLRRTLQLWTGIEPFEEEGTIP